MKKITSRTHHTNKPPAKCRTCCNFFTAKRGRPIEGQKYCSIACFGEGTKRTKTEVSQEVLNGYCADSVTGCWNWTRAKNQFGYGLIFFNGKTHRAHRVSYEIKNGPIPKGIIVRHSCDNPSCINPNHLLLGTKKENTWDMILRGRSKLKTGDHINGTKHPLSKIDESIAEKIFLSEGKHSDIAKKFGVSASLVGGIKRGTHWKYAEFRSQGL